MLRTGTALLIALASLGLNTSTAAPKKLKPPSPQDIQKMEAAMPGKPRVKPAKQRKLLVFTLCQGHAHGAIPFAAKALEIMGQKTGAFEATASDDMSVFEPEKLAQFDAVCMDNTTMRAFTPSDLKKLPEQERTKARERDAELKKSLLDFVRGGKGLIGIHAATDCFYAWPEYGEMMGGYFSGHPWHEDVGIKLDDPAHPLCAAFKGRDFTIKDEIYQFRDPYSRKKLRVLLSIDPARTNMKKGNKIRRKDGDFAVTWVRSYGKGRVFYCSLGHRNEIFWNPMILQHYLDGIQFAMGDLPADTKPSAELSEEYLAKSRESMKHTALAASFQEIAEYKLGQNNAALKLIADRVIQSHGDAAARKALEKGLMSVLTAEATADGKRFACRQLFMMGSESAVPSIAKLLTDDELSSMARYALERMPSPAAAAALRSALGKTQGRAKIGVINSIGERGDEQAVPALAPLLADKDQAVSHAASVSLGKIGGDAAVEALSKAETGASDGLLGCAEKMLAAKQTDKAIAIYERLSAEEQPKRTRIAAFKGLNIARGAEALPAVVAALTGDDLDFRRAAMYFVRTMPAEAATKAFAQQLTKLDAVGQDMLLSALADRGDRIAMPTAVSALASEDESVRVAALRALAPLGDASVVERLTQIATTAKAKSAEQNAARASLDRLTGSNIDSTLLSLIAKSEAPVRAEVVRRLKARRATTTVPALLDVARKDEDKSVRVESLKALSVLSSEKHLPALVDLVAMKEKGNEQTEAEKVVAAVARRIEDEGKRCDVVLAALTKKPAPPVRCSLLRVLGRIGSAQGLPALKADLKHESKDVQDAAIRAISEWPNTDAMPILHEVAGNSSSVIHKVLALRGYARLLALPNERSTLQSLELYEGALELASRDEERKLFLAGLGDVGHPRALALAESYFGNENLQDEAMQAAAKIYYAVRAPKAVTASRNDGKTKNALDGDIKTRWDTGRPQRPGEWFMIDLGYDQEIRTLTLDAGTSRGDYPKGYEVHASTDKEDWGEPVAKAESRKTITEIQCKPKVGRYIKITLTKTLGGSFWSIHEFAINGQPAAPKSGEEIKDMSAWKLTASPAPGDAPKAIDGDIKTRWGTRGKQKEGQWFAVDLGAETKIYRILLDAGDKRNDYPRQYKVYISKTAEDWGIPVGGGPGKHVRTSIPIYPKVGRHIKIVQTGTSEYNWWSIYEMKVFAEPAAPTPPAPARKRRQ